jgi:transcription initiation factor TFIIB
MYIHRELKKIMSEVSISNLDISSLFNSLEIDDTHNDVISNFNDNNSNYKCNNKNCDGFFENDDFMIIDSCYICKKCNTIFDKIIECNSDSKSYINSDNKDKPRCSIATNDMCPNMSLSTSISLNSGSYCKNYYTYSIIKKYQDWNSSSYREISLFNVTDYIMQIASKADISKTIINEANQMYKELSEKKISRGTNRKGLIAACLYMSCKKNGYPRSQREIAQIFNIEVGVITKGCKIFNDIMNSKMRCTNPNDFIERFLSNLNIELSYCELAHHILNNVDQFSLMCENAPASVTAGVIFLIANLCELKNINKKIIADKCFISEVTINKCYKKLDKYKKHIISDDMIIKFKVNLDNKPINKRTRKSKKNKSLS